MISAYCKICDKPHSEKWMSQFLTMCERNGSDPLVRIDGEPRTAILCDACLWRAIVEIVEEPDDGKES